jgi:hypothetical protein
MDHVLGESPQAIALAARAVEYAVKKYGYLALQLVLDHMWSLHHNQSHKRHVPRAVFMIGLLQKVGGQGKFWFCSNRWGESATRGGLHSVL